MKLKLMTRDGGFVRDGEIPPFTPPPEVITWGSRVFVHEHAHRPGAVPLTDVPLTYVEGMAYPIEVMDLRSEPPADAPAPGLSPGTRHPMPPPDEQGFGS